MTPVDTSPGPSRALVLAVVGLGTFLSSVSGSMVAVVLPVVRRDLGADVGEASWVLGAYLVAVSVGLLPVGRLGDRLGHRAVYAAGAITFALGSMAAGLALSLAMMIATRALQGVGAAMLFAIGPAAITTTFPPDQKGRALGVQAALTYIGLTIGPTIGGFLAEHASWRLVFFVNVPGAVLLAIGARGLPSAPPRPSRAFDLPGAILFGAVIAVFLILAQRASRWGIADGRTWAGVALFVASVIALVLWERRAEEAILPTALLRRLAFTGAVVAAYLQYTVTFVLSFVLPFLLQAALGKSPQQAGLTMAAQPLAMAALSPVSGWLHDRIGARVPSSVGMTAIAGGLFWLGSSDAVLLPLVLVGVGSGLFTTPNNGAILGAAPRERQGTAAALLAAARNVGMATGVALGAALYGVTHASAIGRGLVDPLAIASACRSTVRLAAILAIAGAALSIVRPVTNEAVR